MLVVRAAALCTLWAGPVPRFQALTVKESDSSGHGEPLKTTVLK